MVELLAGEGLALAYQVAFFRGCVIACRPKTVH